MCGWGEREGEWVGGWVSGWVERVSGRCGLGWSVLVVRLGVGLDECGTVRVRDKLGIRVKLWLGLNSG